jgi:hypothetical protein
VIPRETLTEERRRLRQHLVRQYVRLQREIVGGEPGCSSYRASVHALRQLGYVLISSGFDEDLDRLLRMRFLEGGCPTRTRSPSRGSIDLRVVGEAQRL